MGSVGDGLHVRQSPQGGDCGGVVRGSQVVGDAVVVVVVGDAVVVVVVGDAVVVVVVGDAVVVVVVGDAVVVVVSRSHRLLPPVPTQVQPVSAVRQ